MGPEKRPATAAVAGAAVSVARSAPSMLEIDGAETRSLSVTPGNDPDHIGWYLLYVIGTGIYVDATHGGCRQVAGPHELRSLSRE